MAETAYEQAVADLQDVNPLCRVVLGTNAMRPIGHDPVGELARRLRGKGEEFRFATFAAGVPFPLRAPTRLPSARFLILLASPCQLTYRLTKRNYVG